MPSRNGSLSPMERWQALDGELRRLTPHLTAVLSRENDFRELRIKSRDDGSTLVIVKAYGADGAPTVCFGVGYGSVAALVAVDATIQGGHWRPDKPWEPKSK